MNKQHHLAIVTFNNGRVEEIEFQQADIAEGHGTLRFFDDALDVPGRRYNVARAIPTSSYSDVTFQWNNELLQKQFAQEEADQRGRGGLSTLSELFGEEEQAAMERIAREDAARAKSQADANPKGGDEVRTN